MRRIQARRARSCAGKACTPATSWTGDKPGTPAYSSHVVDWRQARDAGALAALAQPRGRRRPDPRDAKIDRLYQEQVRLEQELAKARFVVTVQDKKPVGKEAVTSRKRG